MYNLELTEEEVTELEHILGKKEDCFVCHHEDVDCDDCPIPKVRLDVLGKLDALTREREEV